MLRRTSAALTEKDPAYSERFRAFYDLIQTSISTSKAMSAQEVMRREHVKEILQLLYNADGRPIEKTVIAGRLNLKPSNLTRILNMMADARLVERTSYGKQAQFGLTREGMATVSKIAPAAAKRATKIKNDPAVFKNTPVTARQVAGQGAFAQNVIMKAIVQQFIEHSNERRHRPAFHSQPTKSAFDLPSLVTSADVWRFLDPGAVPEPSSSLQQANVDTAYRHTKTYEGSIPVAMKVWEKGKKTEPFIPLPKAATAVPMNFIAMMQAIAKEQDSV